MPLSITSSRFIHAAYVSGFPSFLSLKNIPLYLYSTFCLCTHLLMDIFNLLTVVNNAAIDTNFGLCFQFFGYISDVKLLDQ